jgi:hypothetical protein
MNDSSSNPNPVPPPNPPPGQSTPGGSNTPPSGGSSDWREQRRAERWARREARWQRRAGRHTGWFAGVILIILGLIFLLEQMNIPFLENWWALFILIPAFWAFIAAWDNYKEAGRMTRRATGGLVGGLFLTALTLVFLLILGGGFLWPALLILGGLALLLTAFLPE